MLVPIFFKRSNVSQVKSTFPLFSTIPNVRYKVDQPIQSSPSPPYNLQYLQNIPHYSPTNILDQTLITRKAPTPILELDSYLPKILDGKKISDMIKQEISSEVKLFVSEGNPPPCLSIIIVGQRKDSLAYVKMKEKACKELGMNFILRALDLNTSEEEIIKTVQQLNAEPSVDGILVQMPLPSNINTENVLNSLDIEKDVDGFHPIHMGNLSLRGHNPHFVPCTPRGCIELLKREGIPIRGKHAVVVGRSNIVGTPLALLLLKEDATVTVCHSKTKDIDKVVATGDLVFAAVGSPLMIKKEWIKPGAVCVDIGINAVDDPSDKRGYRLVGDIDYDNVIGVAGRITPVPGGVGPMTVAMLARNTLDSAKRRKNRK